MTLLIGTSEVVLGVYIWVESPNVRTQLLVEFVLFANYLAIKYASMARQEPDDPQDMLKALGNLAFFALFQMIVLKVYGITIPDSERWNRFIAVLNIIFGCVSFVRISRMFRPARLVTR